MKDDRDSFGGRVVQDRAISSSVTGVAICPSMDLVALVLNHKSIIIQRLGWQRLCTLAPLHESEPRISAIVWRPDGKVVAAGGEDGTVAFYQIGNEPAKGAVNRKAKNDTMGILVRRIATKAKIISLWWGSWVDDKEPRSLVSKKDEGSILLVGGCSGCVTLISSEGYFSIGRLAILRPTDRVCNALARKDMYQCAAIGYSEEEEDIVSVGIANLSQLAGKKAQVQRLGAEIAATADLLEALDTSFGKLKKYWVQGSNVCLSQKILGPLKRLMEAHGETLYDFGWEYLWNAFSGAVPDDALMQFLGKELAGTSAKALQREYRNASASTRAEILNEIIPSLELLVNRLSEYRGVLRMKCHSSTTRINVQQYDTMFSFAEQMLSASAFLACVFDEFNERTLSFYEWLVGAVNQAGGERNVSSAHKSMTSEGASRIAHFLRDMVECEKSNTQNSVTRVLEDEVLSILDRLKNSFAVVQRTQLQQVLPEKAVRITIRTMMLRKTIFFNFAQCFMDENGIGATFAIPSEDGKIAIIRHEPQLRWSCLYLRAKNKVLGVTWHSTRVLTMLYCVPKKGPNCKASFETRTCLLKIPLGSQRSCSVENDAVGPVELPLSDCVSAHTLADFPLAKTKTMVESLIVSNNDRNLIG